MPENTSTIDPRLMPTRREIALSKRIDAFCEEWQEIIPTPPGIAPYQHSVNTRDRIRFLERSCRSMLSQKRAIHLRRMRRLGVAPVWFIWDRGRDVSRYAIHQ